MKKYIAIMFAAFIGLSCFAGTSEYNTGFRDEMITRADNLGWAVYFDSQYTEGSPFVIDDTRSQITVDGLDSRTILTYLPNDLDILWSTNDNMIVSSAIGNAFNVRLQFKAKAAVGATFFDIEFDIGNGSGPVIAARTLGAPKASGVEIQYSLALPLFSMGTFVTNGCEIYLDSTPDSATISIYDIQVHVQQIYHPGL